MRASCSTLAFYTVLFCGSAATVQAKVSASIDRNPIGVGERAVLSVTIEGDIRTEPQLPDFDRNALLIRSAGTTQETRIVNGKYSASVTYQYVIVAKQVGQFSIDPIRVQVGSEVQASRAFVLSVTKGPPPEERRSDLFLTATVSKDTPFVGEQVVYSLKVYSRLSLQGGNVDLPEFDGFLSKALGDKSNYRVTVRGRQYEVNEFRRALFATTQGTIEIPVARLKAQIAHRERGFGFFATTRVEERTVVSQKVKLMVRPRPAEPSDFSGLVGEFELKASLTRNSLAVGESTTLVMTVMGVGNAFAIVEPNVSDLSGFKIYDDKSSSTSSSTGKFFSGSSTFRKALVPLRPGTMTIDAVSLRYFDPKVGSYRLLKRGPFHMEVKPGEGVENLQLTQLSSATGKVAVRVLGEDIVPLYTKLDALHGQKMSWLLWLFGSASVAPSFLFFLLAHLSRRQREEEGNSVLKRSRRALAVAKRGLKALRGLDGRARAEGTAKILRCLVGDHVGMEGMALTARDIDGILRDAQVDEELRGETVEMLKRCEAALYGTGAIDDANTDLKGLLKRLDAALAGSQR